MFTSWDYTKFFVNILSHQKSAAAATTSYRKQLLKCDKKDPNTRFDKHVSRAEEIKNKIRQSVTTDHYDVISRVTESCREKKFVHEKRKLKRKFELLYAEKEAKVKSSVTPQERCYMKDCVLNLVGDNLPEDEKEILNLGPKFAITSTHRPYMEIIATTEKKALSLEKIINT